MILGVDEAGRGCLAGPLVVAIVGLDPTFPIHKLADSKLLSENRRFELYQALYQSESIISVSIISVSRVDEINILQATLEGMRQIIVPYINTVERSYSFEPNLGDCSLPENPCSSFYNADSLSSSLQQFRDFKVTQVIIDGNQVPDFLPPIVRSEVKADQRFPEVSAASIIAKVTRDQLMVGYDVLFPEYGFKIHKGYATSMHYDTLFQYGVSPIHRKSFNLSKQCHLFDL
jgi:ribonuclease HII